MCGVQVGWKGGVGEWGDECSVKCSVQTFSSLYLKALTERVVTTEAGSLFQYFTTLTENAEPILRRWLATWCMIIGKWHLKQVL